MGSTILFYGKLCAEGVLGSEDVDINEDCDRNVGRFVSLSLTEILFIIACLG